MIIYDKDETTILAFPSISKEAVHEEELMRSNFVKLSWYSKTKVVLPVGSYIVPFSDNVRYILLEPYESKAEKNAKFKCEPQFQHPIMWLGKLPFIHLEGDTSSWESATKKTDWTYYGTPSTIASQMASLINLMSSQSEDFGNIFGTGWVAVVDEDLPAVASLSFASLDILSAAAEMAQKYECEYHFDFVQRVFYLGKIGYLRQEAEPLVLKSGANVGVTTISGSKEGFYNCFQVSGGTKNMTQESAGNVVRSTNRLTLDEEDYPDSIIYTSEEGEIIDKDAFEESGSHMLVKQLVFDEVYPKMELYIYNLRERKMWLFEKDEQGNNHKIETTQDDGWLDTTDNKYYKYYSKWYCRLAYKEDGVWHDYILTTDMQIPDTKPNLTFQLNGNVGAENTPLAGQEFDLVSYPEASPSREYIDGEDIGNGIQPVQGDYRIEFIDGDIIIPTTSKQGVCPKANAESELEGTPSDKNNIISLGNVIVDDIYKSIAQEKLLAEAEKAIIRLRSDLNSYSFQSNPIDFKKNSTALYIGQKVIYNDGQDLVGGTSYELVTRVQKIVTRLDHPEMVSIVVGNEKRKGSISSLKEEVKVIVAGSITNTGGGSVVASQIHQYVKEFGSKYFLSKVNDDTALGEITLKKGVKIGQYRSRFLGAGAAVDPAGNAEFESIYSRSFISTPEFRFNRIAVTDGEQWCTNGYGTIESVKIGVDENGDAVTNGGLITLHLEENDFASVAAGDICRGIYNDIAGTYNPPAMDNDASYAAGTSAQEGDGIGFSAKRGFFTSYFYIDHIVKSVKGECSFVYKLRSSTTPHPCPFMKFAQYGSFTDATRRASSYATSIGHYYEMVLEGVQTWTIESANVVYRKGYLGDLVIELADGTSRQLQGYGLYAQNNVYFGNAVIQLDPYTLEMLEEDLSTYDVSFGEHVDMIVVDDTGNVIGGIYTETEEGGVTTREYRIHSAITVRKKGTLLTEALAGAEAGLGTYKINFTPIGCSAMIENSTMYITGIDHVKDGVAGSGDDTDFDYDAMRAVDSCRVDFTIDCEGKTSIQKSIPIAIKHDSQPFVGADITNEFSAVSWNTKTQSYAGLPITLDFKMWHNDEVLDITSVDDISVSPSITGMTVAKSIVENASGNKVAHIVISALPADLGLVTDLEITCVATYSGVRYERTLVHTINKSTDTNVYSLIPSVDEVIVNKNTGGLSSNSVDISVVCDSSDNKHYAVAYNQFGTHQICICYKKFYTNGTSDANETEYTGTAVSVDSSVERVSFFLYKKVGTTIDRTVLHDKEDVPIIANGQDGKGVEYIFITQNTETPVPTINDVAADRQVDNYCPYTDAQHTAQWTDEPTGVASNAKFEFYAQRKKVNGVWQEFGEVKLWNRYVVDGVTPYVIDLSNEQSMVACNESGTVVGSYETSKLMLFYGQSYAFNDFAITITPTNITCNNSTVAFTLTAEQKAAAQAAGYFTLTPSAITQDSATIAITATKGNIVLSAVYKVNKAYAGKNGVIYSLIPSLDTIRKDQSGSIVSSDATLTLQVKKTVGASATILTTYAQLTGEGLSLNYVNASGSTALTDVSIATSTLIGSGAWGKIELIKNSVIVDSERINVVFDGIDGDEGYGIVLTITRDNYTEADWSANAVVGGNENFSYSGGVTVRAGDYFIVKGTSTDAGLMHTATFKCTSQTSSLIYGDCISHIRDGKNGQSITGPRGRMYHIMGEYSPSSPYTLTDDLCPVVYYNGSYYYLKNDSQGGNAPTNNYYWGAASDFEMVFTKALFAAFAQLGGFIVWNNWFISQKGTVGGVADQTVNNNFTGTMTNTGSNFIPYLAFDAATGNLYAKKGVIGGFDINSDFLGNTSGDYYTYLSPDGYLALKNPKTGNHAHANGAIYVQGGALIQGDDTHPLRLLNGNGETEVKGNPLNINTNAALTTNIGNGGSSSILSVNSKTTFHQPVSVNTSMAITGLFAAGGNIKTSSFTLPESPEIGQSFFCKGVTTDLTVSVKSGTSHVIMASDSRQTVTSLSLQDNAAILVYMKANTWVHFRCD